MAGNGREVGTGGGLDRLGHCHTCCCVGASVVLMGLADSISSIWPIMGNVFGMIPKSTHASLLRNIYAFCVVCHIQY